MKFIYRSTEDDQIAADWSTDTIPLPPQPQSN